MTPSAPQPDPLFVPEGSVLYLARHATPDRSRHDIPYHTPPGPELTERGRQEAAQLGAFLRDAGVQHILASPLERAWRTAHIASEIAGATVELNLDLAEWRLDEVEQQVHQRVCRAFQLAARLSQKEGPVALVSHGSPTLTLIKALGLPTAEIERHRIYDSRNPIPQAGAWEVRSGLLRLAFVPEGVRMVI